MMRVLKYVTGLLAVVIAGLLVAPFVIDVNNYRTEISSQVEQATGRSFIIGEIHASLFPWIGVELKDVRMANAEGFSRPDFLRAKRLQIQVEVMPLLNHEVVIRSFRLIAPQIFLEKNSRGESSWQDLTGSAPAATPSAASTSSPNPTHPASAPSRMLPALIAKAIVLEEGHIGWRDADGKGVDLDDINLTITDLQQLRPVKLLLTARIGADRFQLKANIGPLGDLAAVDPSRLPMQMQLTTEHAALSMLKPLIGSLPEALGTDPALALDLQLEQRPDGIRVSAGNMTLMAGASAPFRQLGLDWKAELNRSNDIQLRSARLRIDQQQVMKVNGTITRLATNPTWHLRIQSDPLTRAWLSHYLPALDTLYAAHPDGWKQVQLGMLLRGNRKQVTFDDLQLLLNGEPLQGEGSFRAGAEPRVRLTLSGRALHLDPWLPQPKPDAAPGGHPAASSAQPAAGGEGALIGQNSPLDAVADSGADSAGAEPDLRAYAKWQTDIQLTVDKLTVHNLDFTPFRVVIRGKQGKYRLDPLRFGLSGGTVREVATVNINHYPLTWTESLTLHGVQVGPVLQNLADIGLLNGTMEMTTRLRGKGVVADHTTRWLNGKGKLALRDGSIKGFDIAGTLRNLTSFQQQTGPKKTDFSTLSGSFTILDGVVDNRDLFMASPLFRLTGYGTIDLVAKQLDYHAKPKLVGTLTGQGDTLPVRKGLSIPVSITGSLNDPKIRPEIDPMTLINSVGGLLKGGAGGVGSLIKGAGSGAGKLIEGVTGGIGAGVGGAVGALLGGVQQGRSTPPGATIPAPKHRQPATIPPSTNNPNQGALIAPKPKQVQPAPPPPTRQQQLQGVLGGLLNGL